MEIERRQRLRRRWPAVVSGSAAVISALLGLSTNVASALFPADWAAAHRVWVWAFTGGLALVTVVLAAVQVWPRRDLDGPDDPAPDGAVALPVVRGDPLPSYRAAAVQSLIPSDGLRDRDQELRRLAAFTRGDGSYLAVRSPAYGGKTALLAAFVTRPPESTEILAYFTIGRIASQSTRLAFVADVLGQLSELAEDRVGVPDDPLAREAYLLTRLRDHAATLNANGRRLVLVVDGLDEDRGASAGPHTSSIAALLPRHALPGLRVVVSSRSGRPVSPDVPADHPLRRAESLELAPYQGAEADRDAARQELQRLLTGTDLERDVLGLIVAAGGRLTRGDLAELTGRAPFEVDPVLEGPAGRSFAYHEAAEAGVGPGAGFLLAHDTLQVEAEEKFGAERLRGYRDRLANWADDHRRVGWPGSTPRYLLIDYPQMLYAAGEADRLFRLAVDGVRRERLFESSGGGDQATLTELRLARELLVARGSPDLTLTGVVTLHHEYVVRRNRLIPFDLPAIWADLGEPSRAYALAHSIPDPGDRSRAVAAIAVSIAEKGDTTAAVALIRSIPHAEYRASAARRLAPTLAGRGDPDTAWSLLSWSDQAGLRMSYEWGRVLVEVAAAAANSGGADAAEQWLARIDERGEFLDALLRMATSSAERGDVHGAKYFLGKARETAGASEPPDIYEFAAVVETATAAFGPGPDLDDYLAAAEILSRLVAASDDGDTKSGTWCARSESPATRIGPVACWPTFVGSMTGGSAKREYSAAWRLRAEVPRPSRCWRKCRMIGGRRRP